MTIKLKIKNKHVEFTPEEARELYGELAHIFEIEDKAPVRTSPVYIPISVPAPYPYPETFPPYSPVYSGGVSDGTAWIYGDINPGSGGVSSPGCGPKFYAYNGSPNAWERN